MKHYPHHIRDFNQATRHLTRIERSVYRDLMDLYYDTEKMLTLDMKALCRLILAHSDEESTAVEQVLNEFFTETPNGWYHERCEAELEAYRANTSQKAMAGKASAEAKRLKKLHAQNGKSTPVEQPLESVGTDGNGTPTNHQPSTINHQPKKTGRASAARTLSVEKPETVSQSVWDDFVKHRKAKGSPLTQTAMDGIKREADKAGWTVEGALSEICSRGWTGFKADWVAAPAAPAGKWGSAPAAPVFDPDSRSAVEAEALAMGIGPWDQLKEQWSSYKRRVRGQVSSGFAPSIVSLVGSSISKVNA